MPLNPSQTLHRPWQQSSRRHNGSLDPRRFQRWACERDDLLPFDVGAPVESEDTGMDTGVHVGINRRAPRCR